MVLGMFPAQVIATNESTLDPSGSSVPQAEITLATGPAIEVPEAEMPLRSLGAPLGTPPDSERITLTRMSGEFPSGTTYVMSEAHDKSFAMNYSAASPHNVVLVVDCLSYGADFSALPTVGDNLIAVEKLGQGRLALRLADVAGQIDYTVTFAMKHVALTSEQAVELIDSTDIPTTRIAVTEYRLDPAFALSDVLTEGEKGEECVLWEGTPYYNEEGTVTATHTYKVKVTPFSSSLASPTNWALYNVGAYLSNDGYLVGTQCAEPCFKLPASYDSDGALMEICSIRFYEPTDLVRLTEIWDTKTHNGVRSLGRDQDGSDFNEQWGGWTIGERTYDEEKGAFYYEITPPDRWFNTASMGLSDFFSGMVLRWQLSDPAVPLAPDTDYQAANTVITFRLPGDGDSVRNAEVTGPMISTGSLNERNISRKFPDNRAASIQPAKISDQNVIVGSIRRNEVFTTVCNGHYGTSEATYVPAYTGPVTQTYDFPYQIEPLKLSLYDAYRNPFNESVERSVLSAIKYTSWDGASGEVGQSVIDSINAVLNGTSASSVLLGSIEFPADLHIKTVQLKWGRLGTAVRGKYGAHGDSATVEIRFDYRVNNWKDEKETERLPQYTQVQVKYRESYDGVYNGGADYVPETVNANVMQAGQSAASRQDVEKYLWFRLKEQLCPELYGEGYKGTNKEISEYINDGGTDRVGQLGFTVGQYGERYDYIHDPEITLKLINVNNGLANITDDQMIAFFTGEFTAMPRLSGWTFTYEAENSAQESYSNSVTIPAITDAAGVTDQWLPLPEGYAFTSVKLSYDGEADLSHESEADTNTVIWLMKDIRILLNGDIPWLEDPVYVKTDYASAEIRLSGAVTFDITELAEDDTPHCACYLSSGADTHVNGQTLTHSGKNRGCYVYSTRKVQFALSGDLPDNITIYQGDGVGDDSSETAAATWNGKSKKYGVLSVVSSTNLYDFFHDFYGTNTNYGVYPWEDITQAVYVELTDDELVPDPANSVLWNYPAAGADVISEIITVTDSAGQEHRFWKLQIAEGVVRTSAWYNSNGWRWNAKSYAWQNIDGQICFVDYASGVGVSGPVKLAFKSLPGSTLGDHHPVGAIYYDFSDLLRNYHASLSETEEEKSGYDYDRTCYEFGGTNVVSDELNLTGDPSSKLFCVDGSGWTVSIQISMEAGAEIAPGKETTLFDFDPYATTFYTGQEDDLNALVTLKGPGNAASDSIYDLTAVLVLPREGKAINYAETVLVEGLPTTEHHTSAEGEADLYLYNAPAVISNSTSCTPIYAYTLAEDPTAADTAWVDESQITDWSAVTGVKIVAPEVEPQKSVTLRLDLWTPEKKTTQVLNAYGGGIFTYKSTPGGDLRKPEELNLIEWVYENFKLTGIAFWDTLDENGTRNGNNTTEPYIAGVPFTLCDSDGTVITQPDGSDSALSVSDGTFTLYSYKSDAGQYIVAGLPTVTDGSTPKLTLKSTQYAGQSATDSDFDRDSGMLVLGSFGTGGLSNLSAGYVKLPCIAVSNITLLVGETKSADAVISEFVSNETYTTNNILTNGTYKLSFTGADESIASFASTALAQNGNSKTQLKSSYTVTGVSRGEYTVTAAITNRLGDSVEASFVVKAYKLDAPVTVHHYLKGTTVKVAEDTVSDVEIGSSYTVTPVDTYQGKTLTVDSCDPADTITVSDTGNEITMYYTLPLTVTAETYSKTYDGTPLNGSYTVSGALDSDADAIAAALGTAPYITNVSESGEYQAPVDGIPEYYAVTSNSGTLTVSKCPITVTANGGSKQYDGTPITAAETGYAITSGSLAAGDAETVTLSGSITSAGTAEASVDTVTIMNGTTDVSDNYDITVTGGTLTVTNKDAKYEITLVAVSSTENVYDGNVHEAKGVVTDKFIFDGVEYTVSNFTTSDPSQKDAGSYPNLITSEGYVVTDPYGNDLSSQFAITPQNGVLEIVKRAITVTANGGSKPSDGFPLTAAETGYTISSGSIAEGDTESVTLSGRIAIPGSAEAVVERVAITCGTEDVTANYEITVENGTLTITPVEVDDDDEDEEDDPFLPGNYVPEQPTPNEPEQAEPEQPEYQEEPLEELPDESVPLDSGEDFEDLGEDEVPLADVPSTGDRLFIYWVLMAAALGLAVLTIRKKEEE